MGKILTIGIITLLGIFLFVSVNCKNPTSPDDGTSQATVIVINDCGIALDIYMDGNFQFSVEYSNTNTIRNVSLGLHEFVAKNKGTELVIMSISVEIQKSIDFEWTIESSASLTISNEYGETLSIYGDGSLLDDMDSPGILIVQNILLGEHLLEAKRPSDGTIVASITFDFAENKEYFWTITK